MKTKWGLVHLFGGKLGYSADRGFGRKWLPDCIQMGIVRVWNPLMCWMFGHDWIINTEKILWSKSLKDPPDYSQCDEDICPNCRAKRPRIKESIGC